MTAKQKRFVAAYDGNATEAALAAGYSKKTAYAQGHRLLKKAEIAEAIQKREQKRSFQTIMNREERQRFWSEMALNPNAEDRDRLRASELLGKSEGDFIDRLEQSGPGGDPVRTVIEFIKTPANEPAED